MVNYVAVGFSVLRALAEDKSINVPILAHMDVAGVYYSSTDHGVSAPLILGKLPRLAGADMVVYPYYLGKAPLTREQFMQVARNLTFPLYDLKPAWPMASGGIYPSLIPHMIEDLGTDVMVGAGGGVHAHPLGAKAGAMAFRQAIDAAMAGRPLEEAAAEHEELRVALEMWKDPYKELSALSGNGHK
jgi:2,3-diketo-5-methylthiopentyl-1-phosphate enolase